MTKMMTTRKFDRITESRRRRRRRRRLRDRLGIALSFAAMTCWPMATLAVDPPEWPYTEADWQAYLEALIAEFERPQPAPDFYATVSNPTRTVLEHVLPDVNGDGIEDIVAIDADSAGTSNEAGKVVIYSGWISLGGLHEFVSDEIGDGYASVIQGLDDIDGDLIDDFAIGAPRSDLGAQDGGRVDVHSGATGALILRIVGNEANGRLGTSIANAGDCDGDGINDLVVGEPHTDAMRGRAFVFYGADGLGAGGTVMRSPADADLSLTDNLAGAQFGLSVAGVGDLDGDGAPDLAVGSPNRSVVDPDNIDDGVLDRLGAVSVYSGLTGERLFAIRGSVENAWLGKAMLGVPDLDGDGLNELLFSAPGFPFSSEPVGGSAPTDPPATDGRVYVLNSTSMVLLAPDASLTTADVSFEIARPAGAAFQFGDSLEVGHDVDADGTPDILVYSSNPVPVQIDELGGIDLAALGVPLTLPIFTLEPMTHVFSGADGSALYSFVAGGGSGVEINIPYPGPVVAEQTSQVTPIGDTTLDGVVDAEDLAQTATNVGEPATSSPTTDVNQSGVTDVVDVEIVNDVIVGQQASADCFERVENGEFATFCECLASEYAGLDPTGLGDPEDPDCDSGGDDPGPAEPGGGGDCEAEQELPTEAVGCLSYALDLAACEFGPEKDGMDAEQAGIDADVDAANQAKADARADARTAKDAARAMSLKASNAAFTWVAAPATRRAMGNSLAWGAVGVGASGVGTIMVLTATASTGVGVILIISGTGVMIWRIYTTASDYKSLIENARLGFQGNAFGDPANGYATQPIFGNGALLPMNL